ncbi:autotransporter domain-containing protein, partial [Mesorhizobium sp. IMUNJ 23232]|uniref:autotransporter domain-containing protein n=1 Tax=Mesorhizobium sp. IMUNJ 23232 TaxID=3376064 RepID=UPI003792248B
GVLAQSIGGGGGTGGWALSYAVGPGVAIASAVGGAGGGGGDGGTASVTLAGSSITSGLEILLLAGDVGLDGAACSSLPCNMLPIDSFGAVVQSIGGGGGSGGSATAQSLAIAVPVDPDGDQVGVSFSVGVGGDGGTAGDGGLAEFFLTQGSTITTYGQGSTGVLAQSIGGGGGNGGDSSALAAVIGYDAPGDATSLAITGAFTVGGDGGAAGTGGEVLVALGGTLDINGNFTADTAGSAPTSIATFGDYANGVTAQSIGGGGGNAGIGAGNTQSFGTGSSTALAVTLGSTGAAGGAGGQVYTFIGPGNGIATYGSGALGVLAQSVGGGGGTSQGGSVSVAQSFSVDGGPTVKPGVTVNLGADSTGTGGAGGNVNVDVAAAITTHGGDAVGVLAQSVGGGGGLGGSSGSDGSADNPIVPSNGLAAREGASEVAQFLQNFFQDDDNTIPSIDPTFTVTLGGAGAQGGAGGNVEVALSAAITTTGDWASGVIAQSVGGGGGKGGSAAASGTGGIPEVTINANLALAGNGGAGGEGGEVLVALQQGDAAIHTAGYGAAGIVAQSVGGGGGIGADGSDSAAGLISLGTTIDGNGGGGGGGGLVTLNYGNTNGTTVATTGAAADGIILQSVGGGGGIGGMGSSLFLPTSMQDQTLTLSAGGIFGTDGDGGSILLEENYFAAGNVLNVSTQGDYAMGILAQSIGGGGGLITAQPSAGTVTATLGGNLSTGAGGTVEVYATNVNITTQGVAAHGLVAQSIGGGGGYIRVTDSSGASDTPSLTTTLPASSSNSLALGAGDGGNVNVYLGGGGSIGVSGAGAIGILAQSIGGGGGVIVSDNSIFAGSSATSGSDCGQNGVCNAGAGGNVAVEASGDVSATGANGIGIFAQSAGYGTNGAISVSVHATVTGGSGTAATSTQPGASGIQIDGGNSSNEVTVESTGTLTTAMGTSGTAVVQTGSSFTNLWNYGTTLGSTYLNGGTVTGNAPETGSLVASAAASGAFENYGTYHAGAVVDAIRLANHGFVNVGMPGEIRTTHVTGDFVQTGSGQLGVTIDSLNHTASHIHVDGTASIDGVVAPTAITLLPGSVSVVTAGNLVSSADAVDSLVFDWDAAQSSNTLTLTARPDFTPDGLSLTASQASLADYHAQAWNNADAAFAGHFGYLSQITEAEKYAAALDEYSSKDIHAQSIALANSAGTILGSSMSCPVFVGQQVRLDEGNCAWLDVSGRWSDQDATGDIQGYSVSGVSYRIGAQQEIAPDWHLGGSFAYGQTSATMDGGSTGDGDTFDGSVSLTHIMDSWFFAGSVALAHGSFEVDRRVNLPGISNPLESDPSIFLAGGRLRAGYQFAFGDLYLRPYGDLDVIYTHLPGVQESGSSPYALDLGSSSETNVALSAMMEFGGRVDLDANRTLRPYAAFGVSYLPDNTRTIEVSAANQTSTNGTFNDYIETPDVLGRIDLGIQLYSVSGFEVKAGYTADIGDSFLSQSASARLAYHF